MVMEQTILPHMEGILPTTEWDMVDMGLVAMELVDMALLVMDMAQTMAAIIEDMVCQEWV